MLMVTLGFVFLMFTAMQASDLVYRQQAKLTGKISDAFTGQVLAGVTVQIKGSKTTVLSQKDGTYSIELPKNAKTLIVSLNGYQTLEIAISNRTKIDVAMSKEAEDPSMWSM